MKLLAKNLPESIDEAGREGPLRGKSVTAPCSSTRTGVERADCRHQASVGSGCPADRWVRGSGDTLIAVTFLEAAEEVLRSEDRPLSTAEITAIALRRGILQTRGKTPEATMSARLYSASPDSPIKRQYRPGAQRAVRGSVRWIYSPRA